MFVALIEAMRPHQWVKNLLVLAALVFSGKYTEPDARLSAVWAFVLFCMMSSAVYLLNDVVDRVADRAHPIKCNRPVASGRLPVGVALFASGLLAGVGVALATQFQGGAVFPFPVWPIAYFGLNLAYSFWLKRIVIVDCLVIAVGFMIRVHAGAVAIGAPTSDWILLCTFFFALFLAFCKRREEVANMLDPGAATRATIRDYDVPFLDQLIAPLAALSILCYSLYAVLEGAAKHGELLKFTVPFVVFGVFRYLFLVHKRGHGADPARLLFRDPQLVISGLLWCVAVVFVVAQGSPS